MGKPRPILADVLAAAGVAVLYRNRLRPWMFTWGARRDEVTATLPGDDFVDSRASRTTRAVTVDATRNDVWPWLAQIGEDRAGFYSYSVLERAVGAHVHNAAVIHPEWRRLQVGDTIWLARRYGSAARQIVAEVKPSSHLVLVSPTNYERVRRGENASGCWAFVLLEHAGRTRLLARGSGGFVGHFWFDIPHFVMERKMLRGIARRARAGRRRDAPHVSSRSRRTPWHPWTTSVVTNTLG